MSYDSVSEARRRTLCMSEVHPADMRQIILG